MSEQRRELTRADVRHVNALFQDSSDHRTDWELYDSAVQYFGSDYIEGLSDTIGYRGLHSGSIPPFTVEDAQVRVDMYERMFPRVLLARQVMERSYPELLKLMVDHRYDGRADYVEVLSDLLERHPTYKLAYNTESDTDEADYCYSVIQWLRSWLGAEAVDEQG